MKTAPFTQSELEAYLDEALDVERMTQIEQALRSEPELLEQLSRINARRDSGVHTVGEIWRRHQIGVPTEQDLGNYIMKVLPDDHMNYIRFRLETLKCRYTIALFEAMQTRQQEQQQAEAAARRHKYFQSSVGHLKDRER
jgi:hypothetical protein